MRSPGVEEISQCQPKQVIPGRKGREPPRATSIRPRLNIRFERGVHHLSGIWGDEGGKSSSTANRSQLEKPRSGLPKPPEQEGGSSLLYPRKRPSRHNDDLPR